MCTMYVHAHMQNMSPNSLIQMETSKGSIWYRFTASSPLTSSVREQTGRGLMPCVLFYEDCLLLSDLFQVAGSLIYLSDVCPFTVRVYLGRNLKADLSFKPPIRIALFVRERVHLHISSLLHISSYFSVLRAQRMQECAFPCTFPSAFKSRLWGPSHSIQQHTCKIYAQQRLV